MQLLSPAFKNQGEIPSKYTCEGEDMSPPLEIKDIPPQTKSFMSICEVKHSSQDIKDPVRLMVCIIIISNSMH